MKRWLFAKSLCVFKPTKGQHSVIKTKIYDSNQKVLAFEWIMWCVVHLVVLLLCVIHILSATRGSFYA